MDFVKKGADMLSKKSGGSSTGDQQAQAPAAGGSGQPAQQKDYGDKALDFIEKKTGHKLSDSTNEKITDGGRAFYEKQTGSKVDPKWSN